MGRFATPGNVGLFVLGVLALIAISPVGHVVALLAAMSVVGLPIAALIVALPALFLVLLAVRLALGAWNGLRGGATPAGILCAVALVAMADFFVFRAWRVDRWFDHRAAALVAGDTDRLGPVGGIDTLAVLRNTRNPSDSTNPCDDLCRRLLLTNSVKQVLALTAAPPPAPRGQRSGGLTPPEWPSLAPAADLVGTAWRLERRDRCDDPGPIEPLRAVRLPEVAARPRSLAAQPVPSEKLMRLEIAGGNCLVGEDMPLVRADALLAYGHLHSAVSTFGAGYDAWADTLSAWRIAFSRQSGGVFTEQFRRTGVVWERPPWVLTPVLVGGHELRTANGWLRVTAERNRARGERDPAIGEFVTERLGLALRPSGDGAAGSSTASDRAALRGQQARAVDRVLESDAPPSETEKRLIADYLGDLGSSFSRRTNGAGADDARNVLQIVEAFRIALPKEAIWAVQFAAQSDPSTAPPLAAALVKRLEALPAPTSDHRTRAALNEQISAVTGSLAELPAPAVAPYRSPAITLLRDRERRISATRFLGRLDAFGPDIVPDIFAMMDDAASLREVRGDLDHLRRSWAEVWRAGALSICRLGARVPGGLDALRTRAHALAERRVRIPDEVVSAMLRMGATEEDVRATLAVDTSDENAMRSFGLTLRRARRDDACR